MVGTKILFEGRLDLFWGCGGPFFLAHVDGHVVDSGRGEFFIGSKDGSEIRSQGAAREIEAQEKDPIKKNEFGAVEIGSSSGIGMSMLGSFWIVFCDLLN